MSVRVGTGGNVVLASTSGAVLDGFTIGKWTSVFTRGSNDVTPFRVTNNHRDSLGSYGVLTGTIEGFLDGTTPFDTTDFTAESQVAATITLEVNRTDDTGAAGTIQQEVFQGFLSGMSISVAPGVPNPITGRFISTGAIVTKINV